MFKFLKVYLNTAYFAKNWKYCNKIIFKCVNSAIGPIFNEICDEKRGLWVLWTVHETHRTCISFVETRFSKKKWKKKSKTQTQDGAFLHYPNAQLLCPFIIIWKENDVFSSENS